VQVRAAAAYPKAGLVAVDGIQFEGEGTVLMHSLFGELDAGWQRNGNEVIGSAYKILLKSQIIATVSQVMVPISVLREIGPSDPTFPRASDYDLYLRIAAKYPFVLIQEPLVSWRYLANSASGPRERREITYLSEGIEIIKKAERTADPTLRPIIRKAIEERVIRAVKTLCYHGRLTGSRWLVFCEMFKYLSNKPSAIWVLTCAGALWLPNCLFELGSAVHNIVRYRMKLRPK
jgi:hypothetical protein